MKKILFLLYLSFFFGGCIDVIEFNAKEGEKQVVISAFLDNIPSKKQKIDVTYSYGFNEGDTPEKITNAVITLENLSTKSTYIFQYDSQEKTYLPKSTDAINPSIGDSLKLMVTVDKKVFYALSITKPTIEIEKITFFEEKDVFFSDEEVTELPLVAELFATDAPGDVNYWWIQYKKNNKVSLATEDIAIGSNATPGKESKEAPFTDGKLFIPPLRESINFKKEPYEKGDVVSASICAINEKLFDFFEDLKAQNENTGFAAKVLSNLDTNIISEGVSLEEKAIGFFQFSNCSKEVVVTASLEEN